MPCLYPLAPHFPAGIVGIGIGIGLVLVLIGIRILLVLPINILTTSVFNALSIGSGLVVAVLLCMKRENYYSGRKLTIFSGPSYK